MEIHECLWGPAALLQPITPVSRLSAGTEVTSIEVCGDAWTPPEDRDLSAALLVVPDHARWPGESPARWLEILTQLQPAALLASREHGGRLAVGVCQRGLAFPVLAPLDPEAAGGEQLSRLLRERMAAAAEDFNAQTQRLLEESRRIQHQRSSPRLLMDWLRERAARIAPGARVVLLDGRSGPLWAQLEAGGLSEGELATLESERPVLERVASGAMSTAAWDAATRQAQAYRLGGVAPYQVILALGPELPRLLPSRLITLIKNAGTQLSLLEEQRRLRAAQDAVRAEVVRHLLAGRTVPARRAAGMAVSADLFEAAAVEVCVIAAPQEPLAQLVAACEDTLGGRCLAVPDPDHEGRVVVLHPTEPGSEQAETPAAEQLRPVIAARRSRALGASPPWRWAEAPRGYARAAAALAAARMRGDRVALSTTLADSLPEGAVAWAHQLLRAVKADLASCRLALANGATRAARQQSGPAPGTPVPRPNFARTLAELAERVELPTNLAGYATLHLALQLATRPAPPDIDVPLLRDALSDETAQAHARQLLEVLSEDEVTFLVQWLVMDANNLRTGEALRPPRGRNTVGRWVRAIEQKLEKLPSPLRDPGAGRYELYLALAITGARCADGERLVVHDPLEICGSRAPEPTAPADPITGWHPERATINGVFAALLGGTAVFPPDSQLAGEISKVFPASPCATSVQECLARAARYAVTHGVTQLVDVGSGQPTSVGLHAIAQAIRPESIYVAIDNDPMVAGAWGSYLLTNPGDPRGRAMFLQGDATEPQQVLDSLTDGTPVDFAKPALLVLGALPSFLPAQQAPEIIRTLTDVLAPGSYVISCHATTDFAGQTMSESALLWLRAGHAINNLDHDGVVELMTGATGLEVVGEIAPTMDCIPDAATTRITAEEAGMYGAFLAKR